jgi:DNA helicase-2/ATP-dependent DNA helicase PcrA
MLLGLNPEQLSAVTLPQAHALILAGAGSGKTRVLTTRIAWLMQTGQITPAGVLAVTFTNKAAKEMLTRLGSMLALNVRGLWMGTFHGLCNRLLRAHYKLANLPQSFQILDTQDQLSAIKRLCKQHQLDDERFPPKQLQWFIAGAKEEAKRPSDLTAYDADGMKKIEFYQLYEDQCQREGVVDFAELMLRSYELLRDQPLLREHYQRRFKHILIDEFQDTNRLQYAWIKMLSGAESAIFAVGDDDQSIYAFRGARVGNMADFVREFKVEHQIKLEQNYRSTSAILDTANALIENNSERLGKNLRTDQGLGELVRVMESPSDYEEAQWVVEEIGHLLREGKNDPSKGASARCDIALLYRSNAQSRVIESALFNASIPYRVYGGLRFFERAEIKHALAYLRLLENPNDDTSFVRVVNFPPRGIGARTLEQLQDVALKSSTSLHQALDQVGGKAGVNLKAFVAKIDVMREQMQGLTLREIMELVLEQSGLIEHYKSEREGQDRIENLNELVNAIESFVTQEGFGRDAPALEQVSEYGMNDFVPGAQNEERVLAQAKPSEAWVNFDTGETLSPLAAFLSHAALESGDNQAQAGQDAIQLMTVHAAKGLEFDCVFITGLEEGLFPHENSLNTTQGLEEERRLMYVALTRARKRLYLSHAQTRMLHGQTRFNIRSRFFDEMPEHTLKWINSSKAFSSHAPRGGAARHESREFDSSWSGSNWNASNSAQQAFKQTLPIQRSKSETPSAHDWLVTGKRVFHTKFGEGKVLALEGLGDDARAQVDFPRHGVKWLALSVAKLTSIDD